MKKTTLNRITDVVMIIAIILLVAGGVVKLLRHDYFTACCNAIWVYIAVASIFAIRRNRVLTEAVSWMMPVIDTLIEAIKEEQKEENNQ